MRLHEKKGKLNEMPCHHKLETYLDGYIDAAAIAGDRKGPLFRSAIGKTGVLTDKALSRDRSTAAYSNRMLAVLWETGVVHHP